MSRMRATTPEAFRIGDCACPGSPHTSPSIVQGVPVPDGDVALFRPRLTLEGSLEVAAMLANTDLLADESRFMARLGKICLTDGLVWWNLQDDEGKPIPVSRAVLESGALSWDETLEPLANKAADLYGEEALRPLARMADSTRPVAPSSESGPTRPSTSRNRASSSKGRTRSSRSTTAGTRPVPTT